MRRHGSQDLIGKLRQCEVPAERVLQVMTVSRENTIPSTRVRPKAI